MLQCKHLHGHVVQALQQSFYLNRSLPDKDPDEQVNQQEK